MPGRRACASVGERRVTGGVSRCRRWCVVGSESESGFSVVDRRRRGDDEPVRPATSPSTSPSPVSTVSGRGQSQSHPSPPRGPADGPEGRPRADLAALCVMLYSDALVNLGQVPDPVTGEAHRDFEQARFAIDLLDVLREKTEGNRSAEESVVIEEILATLRMAFVHASQRG